MAFQVSPLFAKVVAIGGAAVNAVTLVMAELVSVLPPSVVAVSATVISVATAVVAAAKKAEPLVEELDDEIASDVADVRAAAHPHA